MNFYKECLGGELTIQTVGETPLAEKMPEKMKAYVLHATLTNGNLTLMGSDMVPQDGLIKGNSVSLSLNCDSEEEIRSVYKKLCYGGEATHPLELTFWGATVGGLTDRYGHHWLLHYEQSK
jgi:PhnB protein